ncbi:MAG: tRNA (guanosine(18)-2'-O)-methyltransferase TrmH [Gammaproteobacteria bacterium]|nr:tRNA (guanosine(18)-2'-O)-methyltransferase TrmH [Gammaproteobacteria bacterium]
MTPERFRKLRRTLECRQPDLAVIVDDVHKPHNLAAIVRTCDAVGVGLIHAVARRESIRVAQKTAGGSGKWVEVRAHADVDAACASARDAGQRILLAHLGPGSVPFRDIDWTRATALVLGAELTGPSDAARRCADASVHVPMMGMVESLNVSVACALLLFEAERQRRAAGLYASPRLDAGALERRLFEWAYPRVAAYCATRALVYPRLSDSGEIIEPLADGRLASDPAVAISRPREKTS